VDTDIEYLTSREKDVLIGLSRGMTRKEIARSLGITRTNLRHILGRLRGKTYLSRLKILYLSPRVTEILHCLGAGMGRKEIAISLGITRTNLRHILGRLRGKTYYSKLEEVLLCLDEDFMSNIVQGRTSELGISLYDTWAHQINWCEDVRRNPNNTICLQVRCTNCNNWFMPEVRSITHRVLSINSVGKGENRFYCCEECKYSCPIYGKIKFPKGQNPNKKHSRHPDYTIWAKMIKERDSYECQICGSTENLNSHHYEGLKVNDMQSLDLDMGVTLCKKCHDRVHSQPGCTTYDLQKRNVCGRG